MATAQEIQDVKDAIANCTTVIVRASAALAQDLLDPLMTYSINGETYDRDGWRASMTDAIAKATAARLELVKTLNRMRPWSLTTRQYY